jgi:hypothetical protein
MRYFESFGNSSDDNQMGEINVMQYIFFGDFCDRGLYSLEVILLLFALKVKYNHQSPFYIIIVKNIIFYLNIKINNENIFHLF